MILNFLILSNCYQYLKLLKFRYKEDIYKILVAIRQIKKLLHNKIRY